VIGVVAASRNGVLQHSRTFSCNTLSQHNDFWSKLRCFVCLALALNDCPRTWARSTKSYSVVSQAARAVACELAASVLGGLCLRAPALPPTADDLPQTRQAAGARRMHNSRGAPLSDARIVSMLLWTWSRLVAVAITRSLVLSCFYSVILKQTTSCFAVHVSSHPQHNGYLGYLCSCCLHDDGGSGKCRAEVLAGKQGTKHLQATSKQATTSSKAHVPISSTF